MKILRSLLFVAIIGFSVSCTEEENLSMKASFEQQFLEALETHDLSEKVIIFQDFNEGKLNYTVEDGFLHAWSDAERAAISPGDELCRGTGLSYAKCAKKAMDDGKCIKAYKDGDEYVAEEIKCDDKPSLQR